MVQMSRIHTLDRLSEIVIDGVVTRKLDFLGTVFIHDRHYFNVFRRYNNTYEIVLEDSLGDFHFHRDYTVRESVQRIMCYTDEAIRELRSQDVVAFKNQAPVYEQVVDMRWTEIQGRYAGAAIRLVGVPNELYVKEEKWIEMEEPLVSAFPPYNAVLYNEVPYNEVPYNEVPSYHAVPPFYDTDSFDESQMDWGETPSPTSSGHHDVPSGSVPSAPKKEAAWRQRNGTPRNLSERFSEVSATSPPQSMDNFPDFKVLRNGKKIPNTRR